MDGQTIFCGVVVVETSICLPARSKWGGDAVILHGEVVVDGDEVFRAPGWSAGFLHLHFSVARGLCQVARAEEVCFMLKNSQQRQRFEVRSLNRVSSAAWPPNARRVVATGKAAQRRRDWIMRGRWWVALADALPLRTLLVCSMLLVVLSSLFVAALGLRFWYVLLLPLLFFTFFLLLPLFVARRMPLNALSPGFPTFAQEFRSSSGLLSLYVQELRSNPGFVQELKSNPGFLQELRSNPGYLQELKSNPGFLQELKSNPGGLRALRSYAGALPDQSPATPLLADPPLVRVLETYDLRGVRVCRPPESAPWIHPPTTELLTTGRLALEGDDSDDGCVPTSELPREVESDQ